MITAIFIFLIIIALLCAVVLGAAVALSDIIVAVILVFGAYKIACKICDKRKK